MNTAKPMRKLRGPGRPFEKGDPRINRGGRSRLPITVALARVLSDADADAIAEKVKALALAGDQWAISFLTDRLEGKAVARQETGEAGSFDLMDRLAEIPDDVLRRSLKALRERRTG